MTKYAPTGVANRNMLEGQGKGQGKGRGRGRGTNENDVEKRRNASKMKLPNENNAKNVKMHLKCNDLIKMTSKNVKMRPHSQTIASKIHPLYRKNA